MRRGGPVWGSRQRRDRQQDRRVHQRLEAVPCVGHDEQITLPPLPRQIAGREPDPTGQDCTVASPGFECSLRTTPSSMPITFCRNTFSCPPWHLVGGVATTRGGRLFSC